MKTKLLTICLFLSTILSGCVTGEMMERATYAFNSYHVDELVKVTGMPSEERVIMGKRYLTWYVENSGVIPITSPTTSTATVYGYGGVTNVTITSSETTYVPFNYNCKLHVKVTDKYTIQDITWEGNQGGCRIFYNRLIESSVYKKSEISEKKRKERISIRDNCHEESKRKYPDSVSDAHNYQIACQIENL